MKTKTEYKTLNRAKYTKRRVYQTSHLEINLAYLFVKANIYHLLMVHIRVINEKCVETVYTLFVYVASELTKIIKNLYP